MCVRDADDRCVLQFTLRNAAGCALHRRASRVIRRSELFVCVDGATPGFASPARRPAEQLAGARRGPRIGQGFGRFGGTGRRIAEGRSARPERPARTWRDDDPGDGRLLNGLTVRNGDGLTCARATISTSSARSTSDRCSTAARGHTAPQPRVIMRSSSPRELEKRSRAGVSGHRLAMAVCARASFEAFKAFDFQLGSRHFRGLALRDVFSPTPPFGHHLSPSSAYRPPAAACATWFTRVPTVGASLWPLLYGYGSMILTQVHLRKPCYDFYFL